MRYIKRIEGEPFEVQSHEVTRWSCCDCGLVHDIAFVARGDVIEVAARVNRRATAAKRRNALLPAKLIAATASPTAGTDRTRDAPLLNTSEADEKR